MPENHSTPLISQLLLEDADLRDVVEEFVDTLPQRVTELQQAYDQLDLNMLATLAHRLKGAGGSYGYPDISQLAAQMERGFRNGDSGNFREQIDELTSMIEAARTGLAQTA